MPNPNPPNQFKPGQSGNPNGRPPKEWTWSGLLKEKMEAMIGEDGLTIKDAVASSLLTKAMEGDVSAIKEVGNRVDGMPAQALDLTSKGDKLESPMVVIDTHGKD